MDDRQQRGRPAEVELLSAHFRSLDPDTATAEERLQEALGPELTHKLLFALAQRVRRVRRAA